MHPLYDFFTQNPVGYAIGLILTLVAVVKKDWGARLGYGVLALAWLMIMWSAFHSFKDWRAVAVAGCLSLAAIFWLCIILWPYGGAGSKLQPPQTVHDASGLVNTKPKYKVFIEAHMRPLPNPDPSIKPTYHWSMIGMGMSSTLHQQPESFPKNPLNSGIKNGMPWGVECHVTNDGTEPLANLNIPFLIEMTGPIPYTQEHPTSKATYEWSIDVPVRLYPGKENAFTFNIVNLDEHYTADITFPANAYTRIPGQEKVDIPMDKFVDGPLSLSRWVPAPIKAKRPGNQNSKRENR